MNDDVKAAAELVLSKPTVANKYDNAAQKVARAYLTLVARPVPDVVRDIVREAVVEGQQSLMGVEAWINATTDRCMDRLAPFLRDARADDKQT